MEVEEYDDLEFETLCKGIYYGYIYCRIRQFRRKCSSVSEPMINEFEIDWRQRVREDRINAIQNPEIASDQVEEISYDDGSNDENDELEQEIMGFKELITMEAMPCL